MSISSSVGPVTAKPKHIDLIQRNNNTIITSKWRLEWHEAIFVGTSDDKAGIMTTTLGFQNMLFTNYPNQFPSQRPVTQSFDGFFYLRLNKRLSKQSRRWWFETPSCPLWRHCNEILSKWITTETSLVKYVPAWPGSYFTKGYSIEIRYASGN